MPGGLPTDASAQTNIGTSVLEKFTSRTDDWWRILRGYAFTFFKIAVTLEIAIFGIKMILQQKKLNEIMEQFVMLLLYACFISAVITYYEPWTKAIALKGLEPLVGELAGNNVDAGTPIAVVMALCEKIVTLVSDLGFFSDIIMPLFLILIFLFLIVIFVLISALYIITVCEFHIIANIGVLLVGLGGSRIFKDYAINVMRYVLSVAVKLFVLKIIMNIGFQIITVEEVKDADFSVQITEIIFILAESILLLALSKALPDTCAGILSGATINGGNPLLSVASSAAVMAAGAATGGAGYVAGAAKTGATAIKSAHTVAKAGGAQGVVGTAKGMLQAGWNARKDAKANQLQNNLEKNSGSMVNQLRSQASAARAQMAMFGSGGSGVSSSPPAASQEPAGGSSSPVPSSYYESPVSGSPDYSPSSGYGSGTAARSSATTDWPVVSSQSVQSNLAPAQPVPIARVPMPHSSTGVNHSSGSLSRSGGGAVAGVSGQYSPSGQPVAENATSTNVRRSSPASAVNQPPPPQPKSGDGSASPEVARVRAQTVSTSPETKTSKATVDMRQYKAEDK